LDKAEEMSRKSLELEALGSKQGMAARDYGNLGIIYRKRGELAKAEEMSRKSLDISEVFGFKGLTAEQYDNLGSLYKMRGELDQAEAFWKKSLSLYQEMGAMQNPNAEKVQQALDQLAQERNTSTQ
jgi:tetratricopeptide (TPR) repeat protein